MQRQTARRTWLRGVLAASLAVGLLAGRPAPAAAPSPVIAVIVHADVPVKTVSRAELAAIFLGSLREWPSGLLIRAVNATPELPARGEFDRVVLKMNTQKVTQHWIDKRVRGQGTPPRELPTADLIARIVASTPGAIGYVPLDKVSTRTRVVAHVREGKVVTP